MANGPTLKMKKRLNRMVMVAVIVAFAIVAANLVNISIIKFDFYNDYADAHQLRPETIPASRGTIYDRNLEVLAASATVWDITINPQEIKDDVTRERIVKGLAEILEMDEETIREMTYKNTQYVNVKRKVEKEVRDQVIEFMANENVKIKAENEGLDSSSQLPTLVNQIVPVESTKRYYPNGTLAASVLGFTGTDSQGLYGIEAKYDEALSGTPGYILSLKNALSQNIPNSLEEKHDPIDGNSLVLTLDETIQHFVEKALTQAMSQYDPLKGCCAIVQDVNTGAILAMANMPTFDCNDPFTIYDDDALAAVNAISDPDERKSALLEAQKDQWYNKSISYAYQPGSTFKTIVASAALEEKTSSLNEQFYCSGSVQVADRTMHCHNTSGHGSLDFTGAIVNSCNPSFIRIGAQLGPSLFFQYFKSFGLTERTGIDLPAEGESVYYDEKGLQSEVVLASCSFGQSTAITPIQLITAVSAVTNGGKLMQPYIVKDILDANGNIVTSTQPTVKRQVISEETSETMRDLMEAVVIGKGSTNATVKGYRIGGKSGTSQKQNPGDDPEARISSYVAVAPIDDPQIAVLVMVDEPQSQQKYGSVVAAPVCASIMADTLPYLGYSPKYTTEEAAEMEVTVPTLLNVGVLEAESKLSASGLGKPKVVGSGNTVVRQVPTAGSAIPRDGTVIIYTEDSAEEMVTVPDVINKRPSQAKQQLEDLHLNVIVNGVTEGNESLLYISTQSIEAGTEVPIGTVIELTSIKVDTD